MNDPRQVDPASARVAHSSALTFLGLLAAAVLTAVLLGQVAGSDPPRPPPVAVTPTTAPDLAIGPNFAVPDLATTREPDRPIGAQSLKRCTVRLGGLALSDPRHIPGWALERWDCDAPKGPWSVVIRGTGGHFGVNSAVVTFPVEQSTGGSPAANPKGATWSPDRQQLVWPLAGSYAQIVGDIGQVQLANLAMAVTIESTRPHLSAPEGYTVSATIPYRSPVVHEMRYSTKDLGQEARLGDGLVYTGVMPGASFESRAFQSRAVPAGVVRGRPAIYSAVQGGNATLAWESAPGEVTYIGFSGTATQPESIKALRSLAGQGRQLNPGQWETKDRVPVGRQPG